VFAGNDDGVEFLPPCAGPRGGLHGRDEFLRRVRVRLGGLRNVALQGRADSVEVAVLVDRGLHVAADPVEVALFEHGGRNRQPRAFSWRRGSLRREAQPERGDVRDPVRRLRQRHQRGVHGVVAVQVGIENQVRRVADVRDHRPDVGDEVQVLLVGRLASGAVGRTLERLPFLPDRLDAHVLALAGRKSFWCELQRGAQPVVGLGEPIEGSVHLRGHAGRRGLRARSPDATRVDSRRCCESPSTSASSGR
jgi:hypothetical protein